MKTYKKLISLKTVSGLSTDQAIEHIGVLADAAMQTRKKKGLVQARSLSGEIEKRPLTFAQQAVLNYHISNIWGNLHKLSSHPADDTRGWESENIERQLTYLRKSVIAAGKDNYQHLDTVQMCPIITNLAATLYHIGRFVEALEHWNNALELRPNFSMARGNRGLGLVHYAHALYDDAQALIFLYHARQDLKSALENDVEHHAEPVFKSYLEDLDTALADMDTSKIDLKTEKSNAESGYKTWCLQHGLFLNPLNDLGAFPAAASDTMCTPSIVMVKGEMPYYHGFYNQIKQEFVSARWLYYDGLTSQKKHLSDSRVLLLDTLDHPVYGLGIEKIKISFRMLYSLFDKIAFFLNRYLNLSIREKKVHFRTLWYISRGGVKTLRPEFADSENWPLKGLFWLSKDLYEDRIGFKDALEPDAGELHTIRNHLEHKYFKLLEPPEPETCRDKPAETFGFIMYRDEFEIKVLRLMKIVRAALIYLALAIHSEENTRLVTRRLSEPIQVMELSLLNGEQKQ